MSASLHKTRILDEDREALLAQVRSILGDLRATLARGEAGAEDDETLAASMARLDDLFVLVVVGEFNAGKSAFVNALLGATVLEEGVTPTTSKIQVLEHGEEHSREIVDEALDRVSAPVALLRDVRLVDTPGVNAIERRHQAITEKFIPQADLILFVTSADRPFSESERAFLADVRQWGKNIVAVINKADILATDADVAKVETFVREGFHSLLDVDPKVFAVSSREAQAGKAEGDDERVAASGFDRLEEHIVQTLDEGERFRLKLLNPLGVATRLIGSHQGSIASRLEVLDGDIEAVGQIESQLQVYEKDLRGGFELRFSDVDLILHQFEARGHDYFEELFRLGRIFDLLNKSRIQREFQKFVIGDAPEQIESKVDEIIDWLITSDLEQWRAVRDHFERRRSEHSERILGRLEGGFEYNRARLLETVGKAAQDTLAGYDKSREARRMADGARDAVTNAALLEVGAVGLGAAISLAASSTAADITGIAAAGLMAAVGFFILPHKRRKAKEELREKISTLRESLRGSLNEQLEREIKRSSGKIRETIAPYTRFVRGEQETLEERRRELDRLQGEVSAVRAKLDDEGNVG